MQTNHEVIKSAATMHFKDLLTKTKMSGDYSDLLQNLSAMITEEMNNAFNKEIDKEEVKNVI